MARLSSLPIAGNYQLEIIARDPTGINIPSMAIVDVYVLVILTITLVYEFYYQLDSYISEIIIIFQEADDSKYYLKLRGLQNLSKFCKLNIK